MRRKSLVDRIPLALLSAVLVGAAMAFFFFAMPMVLLEQGVIASGLPTLIAAAGPPLGGTARALVAGTFALLSGGLTWGAVTLVGMIGSLRFRRPREPDESEPSFPEPIETPASSERRPLFAATDLGMLVPKEEPELELVEAEEEPSPAEHWNEPAFEPLEVSFDDVLELVDVVLQEPAAPIQTPLDSLSIAELMARLEAGAERRAAKSAPSPIRGVTDEFDGALRSALEDLQRMGNR
jgi:hypothetical protein